MIEHMRRDATPGPDGGATVVERRFGKCGNDRRIRLNALRSSRDCFLVGAPCRLGTP